MKWCLVLAGLLAVGGLAACDIQPSTGGSRATLKYTEDARRAYQEAMAAFRAREWEDARALFQDLQKIFPYSRYAKLAALRIADVDFELERFPEAVSAYREWIQNNRTDKDVAYARYRIGKALYEDINDGFLQPPTEERDQAVTLDAYKELRSFLRQFPRNRYSNEAAFMLEAVTGRLVRHELYVAHFYLKVDRFEAALARIDYALRSYPNSGLDPEALVLKGETLLKMKKVPEARGVFQTVVKDWGGPFASVAKRFLDDIGDGPVAVPKAQDPVSVVP
ncbi:outer membrane protein assembly factor BamD [Chondromyces apiculatus]|uniref:Competence protein ComL n=1 Tax=Chondromyces apiculatus DSM 436 TaxID=1192034 RepID=A0A017SXB8_9BACT|nr:outer membrane protein assembly factor BamD [Chondromyces apiculatus]EYF01609.1 Competence protein ComL precursor [Chondromyces apiculatus DSM 436]